MFGILWIFVMLRIASLPQTNYVLDGLTKQHECYTSSHMKTELSLDLSIDSHYKFKQGLLIHLSFSCLVVVLHMRPQRKFRRAYRRVWWGLGPPRATLTPHSHEGPEVSGGGQGEQAARPSLLNQVPSGHLCMPTSIIQRNRSSEPSVFNSIR